MYTIEDNNTYLLVKFEDTITGHNLRMVIRQELLHPGANRNIVWHIGGQRTQISLSELLSIADDFKCLSSGRGNRKTALVVAPGLTESIMRLLAKAIGSHPSIKCRTFCRLEEALEWINAEECKVA